MAAKEIFTVFLVHPSRYSLDGYPLRFRHAVVPSNSLACLYGLTKECVDNQVLGEDVDMRIHTVDEGHMRVDAPALVKSAREAGGKAILMLVGVQSNQFPRAMDIATPFLEAGIPVCVGGFHVSGCVSMLPELPEDLVEAQERGVSFFLGEAEEGRLNEVFTDAFAGKLKPQYNHLNHLPDLSEAPLPIVPKEISHGHVTPTGTIDFGRGCPFQCSFCTIINVQGRKSRFRSADDAEGLVRTSLKLGVRHFFITDDNFARNKNWEAIFDRLGDLRESGLKFEFSMQVDTMCHKIPNFIEKSVRAGVRYLFIGLENINPSNLLAAKKQQNKIAEYRKMLLAWKKHSIFIACGYIVGFPQDTKESVMRDIDIIREELPLDVLYFNILTPLPGSMDHKKLVEAGADLDPDMNKYNLQYCVSDHPTLSRAEVDDLLELAWRHYYTRDHMITVMKRVFGVGSKLKKYTMKLMFWHYLCARGPYTALYKLEAGVLPLRNRRDRRSGMKRENPIVFYSKYVAEIVTFLMRAAGLYAWFNYQYWKIARNPKRADYMDTALTPPTAEELDELKLYKETAGAEKAVAIHRLHEKRRANG